MGSHMTEVRKGDMPISRGRAFQARETAHAMALGVASKPQAKSPVCLDHNEEGRIVRKEAGEVAKLYSISAKSIVLPLLAHLQGWKAHFHLR